MSEGVNISALMKDLREAIGLVLVKHGVVDFGKFGISFDPKIDIQGLKLTEIAITDKNVFAELRDDEDK